VSNRPVVGVSAAIEPARWGAWDVEVNLSQRTYSNAIAAAGALPVILPPDDATTVAPDETLDLLDALLLAGGADVDPAAYGAEAHPKTVGTRLQRDAFELSLARRAIARRLPLLGICRGMEILNIARGGTLDQHLATASTHLHTPGQFSDHEVVLEPGSLAAGAVGAEQVSVRSHHHQGISELGEGLVVSGRSVGDEVVEAIELPGAGFVLGVLWHTEEEAGSAVIGALAEAGRSARRAVEAA